MSGGCGEGKRRASELLNAEPLVNLSNQVNGLTKLKREKKKKENI